MMAQGISRRSLFTGIAAAALAPMLPRFEFGRPIGFDPSGRWGFYDDSFLGHKVYGMRITHAHGRYRLLWSDVR